VLVRRLADLRGESCEPFALERATDEIVGVGGDEERLTQSLQPKERFEKRARSDRRSRERRDDGLDVGFDLCRQREGERRFGAVVPQVDGDAVPPVSLAQRGRGKLSSSPRRAPS
jgi:hypothetical protein